MSALALLVTDVSWDPPSMSLAEISVLVSIIAVILGALVWLIRAVGGVRHETRPNSGASMRDAVNRIEADLKEMRSESRDAIARVETQVAAVRDDVQVVHGRVTAHTEWHLDHAEGRSRTRSSD